MGLSGEASAPLGVRSAATALRSCLRQQQVGDRLPFSEDGGSPTSRAEETLRRCRHWNRGDQRPGSVNRRWVSAGFLVAQSSGTATPFPCHRQRLACARTRVAGPGRAFLVPSWESFFLEASSPPVSFPSNPWPPSVTPPATRHSTDATRDTVLQTLGIVL